MGLTRLELVGSRFRLLGRFCFAETAPLTIGLPSIGRPVLALSSLSGPD